MEKLMDIIYLRTVNRIYENMCNLTGNERNAILNSNIRHANFPKEH